jgi:predicted Zn-dependent peptidase
MNHWKKKIKIISSDFQELPIIYVQRKGFQSWMAYISCSFGSVVPGFPDGSAHFLEHRLFDIDDQEATGLFSALGSDVNAFTSRKIMGFYFSTLRSPFESIQLLIDLVLTKRTFDQRSIKNEKKIIESEIMMVEDDPYAKGYQQLIEQLYWKHPIRIKIAGTKESIKEINSAILSTIHTNYFNPKTCKLMICGAEDPNEFFTTFHQRIMSNNWNPPQEIEPSYFFNEPMKVKTSYFEIKMPVSKDLFLLGFKTKKKKFNLTDSLIGEFIGHIVFGSISSFVDILYGEKLIDDTFYFSYDWDIDYGYLVLSSYTPDPDQLKKQIEKEIEKRIREGINAEEFEIIKHYFLGSSYMLIDKPSDLMMHLANLAWLNHNSWEDYLKAIQDLTLEKINQELGNFIDLDYSSVTLVRPL